MVTFFVFYPFPQTFQNDFASGASRIRKNYTSKGTCWENGQGFKGWLIFFSLLTLKVPSFDCIIKIYEQVSGKVTYCGHELSEFVPHRTCAYISQHDLHQGELTVRETLDFSGRCLGVGARYDLLVELSRRQKEAGIKPDPEIDAFMKATAVAGQEASLVTDYVLKVRYLYLFNYFFSSSSRPDSLCITHQ